MWLYPMRRVIMIMRPVLAGMRMAMRLRLRLVVVWMLMLVQMLVIVSMQMLVSVRHVCMGVLMNVRMFMGMGM